MNCYQVYALIMAIGSIVVFLATVIYAIFFYDPLERINPKFRHLYDKRGYRK
jgi:hypothetical protein